MAAPHAFLLKRRSRGQRGQRSQAQRQGRYTALQFQPRYDKLDMYNFAKLSKRQARLGSIYGSGDEKLSHGQGKSGTFRRKTRVEFKLVEKTGAGWPNASCL